MNSPTSTDIDCESEIVTEVRRIKRRLSDSFGGDFHRMCEATRQRQVTSGHVVVDRSHARAEAPAAKRRMSNAE